MVERFERLWKRQIKGDGSGAADKRKARRRFLSNFAGFVKQTRQTCHSGRGWRGKTREKGSVTVRDISPWVQREVVGYTKKKKKSPI